jgi:hypothetical protein
MEDIDAAGSIVLRRSDDGAHALSSAMHEAFRTWQSCNIGEKGTKKSGTDTVCFGLALLMRFSHVCH